MKTLKFLFIALALLSPLVGFAKSLEPIWSGSLTTRFGTITQSSYHRHGRIKLDGKVIYKSDDGILLYELFHIGNTDAVLFGENCVGSCQNSDTLYFILLTSGKPPRITDSFSSSDFTLEPTQMQNSVVINLGYEDGKQKFAELNSGKITVRLVQVATQMDDTNCMEIFKLSTENCIRSKSIGLECKYAEPSEGSSAGLTEFRVKSQLPGFNSPAMHSICQSECESSIPIPYEIFKKEVCSIK